MLSHRILAAAGAALALATAPAGALAQSGAGDQQYADPFAKTPTPQSSGHAHRAPTHSSGGSGGQTSQPSATVPSASSPAPSSASVPVQSSDPSGTSSTASPTATSSDASGTATPSGTLPRTGIDSLGEALAGGVLLLAGLGLRMRARRRGPGRVAPPS